MIYTKTYQPGGYSNPVTIEFDADGLTVSEDQIYKTTPIISLSSEYFQGEGASEENWSHFYILETIINPDPINGRMALYYLSDNTVPGVVATTYSSPHIPTVYFDCKTRNEYEGQTQDSWSYNLTSLGLTFGGGNIRRGGTSFSSNIPVFSTAEEAWNYIQAPSEESALILLANALNYKAGDYSPEETKVYTYSSFHSNVSLLRGTITPTSEIGYRTLKIQANTPPAFYLNEGSFELSLIASDIVASIYAAGPESVVENMPESQWTENALAYNGPFYCTLNTYIDRFGETPGDGTYVYPTEFQTNIDIFGSREDAEEFIRTGDNSKAIRRGGGKEYDVKIGEEEQTTEFGGGGFMSPFMTILTGSKSDINRFKDVLFTNDSSLWNDIKKGLEMYGSNPIDYVISCKAFGFDVSKVVNESTRNDVWFGSYQYHFATAFNEVINMSHKYISAGSFVMRPIQYCYLDFEPYTTLSAWFPYHGWEQLDIKKYYNKNVEIRYYVDILTGQGVIITLCNGIITDQFGPIEMGTELPLTGANYAQWAQGQVRLLTQAASSLVGGISQGATSGSVAGFAASSLTSLIPASQAIQGAKQMGGPKNTMITKGNFGSNLGNYFPGYVIFRFDIHDMLEPNLLRPLVGRPSYSSGNVRDFSGFLSGKVVKLDTSGMTDAEAEMVRSLLKTGIYV